MSGSSLSFGFRMEDMAKVMPSKLKTAFDMLKNSEDVSYWFDLVRQCRHPSMLWDIDFILPRDPVNLVNEYIQKSEKLLYDSDTSLQLKEPYTADIYQEVTFHTIRAYLRAEEGDFDASLKIWDNLTSWLEKLSLVRKSNLLFHLFKCYLCTNRFQKSYNYFCQHWYLIKYCSMSDRFNEGIWDNMSIMYMIMSFFIEHTDEYKLFLSTQDDIVFENLHKHKKVGLIYSLSYDHSWIVSQLSLDYYNKAREYFSTLPEYKTLDTTPRNTKFFMPQRNLFHENKYQGWQKHYYEKLLSEGDKEGVHIDCLNNYFYSFYHFSKDYKYEESIESELFEFLRKHQSSESSVLYSGCGLCFSQNKFKCAVQYVDISEQMVYEGQQKDIEITQMSIDTFLSRTSLFFDLLFSCGVLEHLSKYQIGIVLEKSAAVVSSICCYIETIENKFEMDILQFFMHRTVKPIDWWKEKFEQYFECDYLEKEKGFFVYGTCRK